MMLYCKQKGGAMIAERRLTERICFGLRRLQIRSELYYYLSGRDAT